MGTIKDATGKRYVFIWNNGTEVIPSKGCSEEEVWDFAIRALRPAGMDNDIQAEKFIRANGSVVEYEDE